MNETAKKKFPRETPVSISDYGRRFIGWYACGDGYRQCGTGQLIPFLRVPKYPTLEHSFGRLLYAINLASAIQVDRPTRKDVRAAFMAAARGFGWDSYAIASANAALYCDHYWRDLFRMGYVNQYRRTYGPGSGRHFDIVYELSPTGTRALAVCRANSAGEHVYWPAPEGQRWRIG